MFFEWRYQNLNMLQHSWIDTILLKNYQDFQMRNCASVWVKGLQTCHKSNQEVKKIAVDPFFLNMLIVYLATFLNKYRLFARTR